MTIFSTKMKNDLGVDPDEWFENPLDSMPIANGTNKYHPDEDYAPSEYEPPYQETDWFIDKPDEIEQEKTMHQKMYEIATARYNPFAVGGSENCDSDISCNNLGGSEERLEDEEYTPENDPYGGY